MSVAEVGTLLIAGLNFLAFLFVPKIYGLFKTVHDLEIETVKLKGELEKNNDKIEHIEGNYKQSIEFVRESIEGLKVDLKDIKDELKEIIEFGRRVND